MVTAAWAASFCLGCDSETFGADYCSERCHLKDKERVSKIKLADDLQESRFESQYPVSSAVDSLSTLSATRRRSHELGSTQLNGLWANNRSNNSRKSLFDSKSDGWGEKTRLNATCPRRQISRVVGSEETTSVPSDESSEAPRTRHRFINVPRRATYDMGSTTEWDIWRPRRTSLAVEAEDIMAQLPGWYRGSERQVYEA
ncbi:hypothetical protein VFPPC_18203 [Pochonia chlamydosporia 170]|uniref:Life-span regulatory factor domain-containing protein n=1 Tax=Pochonia chlamydosporia 170 TaxID=1380566 RepID=A0A219APF0_METCM|nr:hypothetical protein VFPPC_18203 [Pochonia chlamydosporia 170]OWT42643.1 hypothetical protein VFPPC_18203 [Pochonia chlamydosporia 170]